MRRLGKDGERVSSPRRSRGEVAEDFCRSVVWTPLWRQDLEIFIGSGGFLKPKKKAGR